MGSGTFSYGFEAGATLSRAVALLGDLRAAAELHPSISRIERVDAAPGAQESYRMVDSTRWGPLAFALEYRTDLVSAQTDDGWARITTRARQAPGIRFWNETTLVQRGDRLHGLVGITLATPPGLQRWALEGMRARHAAVLPQLVDALERGSGR